MTTKLQAKPRHVIYPRKIDEDEEDIIEIKEIPSLKQGKNFLKHKDNTDSSEATTPNKKGKNKKKEDNNSIRIMEIEDDSLSDNKKGSAPVSRHKNSVKKEENENEKKKEKTSGWSVSKINKKVKNKHHKGKKEDKKDYISLDESDNENNNIKSISEIKISSQNGKNTSKTPNQKIKSRISITPNKKSNSKTPNKKIINKNKDNIDNHNKKYKANEKVKLKNKKSRKEEENIQCQLLSGESQEEKIQKKNLRTQIQKRKKSNNTKNNISIDKINSGYLSSRKSSLKNKSLNDGKIKSKSTIKVGYKKTLMKDKINNLLGKKRKRPDNNQKEQSKTVNKQSNKSESISLKIYPKQKNKVEKVKSRTPYKNVLKKNNKTHNLLNSKMDIEEFNFKSKKKYVTPELAVLSKLISEYGFERVLDTLCKPKLDTKNKIDSYLQKLKDSSTNAKLPVLLVRMLFSYFESRIDYKRKISRKKRSTSVKKVNFIKNHAEHLDKSNLNNNKSLSSLKDNVEEGTSIQIQEEEIKEKTEKKNNEKKKKR